MCTQTDPPDLYTWAEWQTDPVFRLSEDELLITAGVDPDDLAHPASFVNDNEYGYYRFEALQEARMNGTIANLASEAQIKKAAGLRKIFEITAIICACDLHGDDETKEILGRLLVEHGCGDDVAKAEWLNFLGFGEGIQFRSQAAVQAHQSASPESAPRQSDLPHPCSRLEQEQLRRLQLGRG